MAPMTKATTNATTNPETGNDSIEPPRPACQLDSVVVRNCEASSDEMWGKEEAQCLVRELSKLAQKRIAPASDPRMLELKC